MHTIVIHNHKNMNDIILLSMFTTDRELFIRAIKEKDIKLINELAYQHHSMENVDNLIVNACIYSNAEIVEILLQHGFKTKYLDFTHIRTIFSSNKIEIIKLLLDYADDYSLKSIIFSQALDNDNYEVIKYCLTQSLIDQIEINSLFGKIKYYKLSQIKRDVIKLLISYGADVNCNNSVVLMRCCFYGYKDIVVLLLNNGANAHAENNKPFMMACSAAQLEIVELLLQYGIDINSIKNETLKLIGENILQDEDYYYAKKDDYLKIIKILFEYGADSNSKDALYLLYISCLNGYIDVVKYYLCFDININNIYLSDKYPDGVSLLHAACVYGNYEILALLVKYGFDINNDYYGINVSTRALQLGRNDNIDGYSITDK